MPGKKTNSTIITSSFRDPSGFLFTRNNNIYRQVNISYSDNFQNLIASGLYTLLVDKGFLIPHAQVDEKPFEPSSSFIIIKPELIPFISYPYEWCFSQLKDAALTYPCNPKNIFKVWI